MRRSIVKTLGWTLAIAGILIITPLAYAITAEQPASSVRSITLKTVGAAKVGWSVDGYSSHGFKVVWSKSANPTYPTRENDRYHYYSAPDKSADTLEAFNGEGQYYVRVCEYLGGKCGVYSNQVTVTIGAAASDEIACTLEYNPVCGEKQVQCIKAPCNPVKQTYGNKCQLAAAKAKFLYAGECKKEIAAKPTVTDYQAKIRQLEAKIKKVEAENRRLFKLIKLREAEIKTLKEALEE